MDTENLTPDEITEAYNQGVEAVEKIYAPYWLLNDERTEWYESEMAKLMKWQTDALKGISNPHEKERISAESFKRFMRIIAIDNERQELMVECRKRCDEAYRILENPYSEEKA